MTAVLVDQSRPVAVRPAPRREPPFDDEVDPARTAATTADRTLPFVLVHPQRPVRPWALPAAVPTGPAPLPDPGAFARRLLVGLVEAAAGRRPLHQLAAFLSPSVHRGIGTHLERAALGDTPHWLARASVRTVHASRPDDDVAELCATLETGARVRAVALRLEINHGRWRCTRLQLG